MSGIRSILVHLDASASSAPRLAVAQALARRLGAALTALFGVGPDPAQGSFAYSAGAALQDLEERASPVDGERSRLQALFAAQGNDGVWCDVVGDSIVHAFVAEAAYADLLVVGAPRAAEDGGGPPAAFAESVILQSGAPALVVPATRRHARIGERALVAWNGSAQAARALKAALPLLALASEVHVASWARQVPAAPFSKLDLRAWLRRHGIAAHVEAHPPVAHVADALRGQVLRLGCDLVVMGCYGHSRIREQVFGGVTRGALARLPVPILMAH
jgi:nucleotide-binding universal stress UspA family protein